MPRWWVKAAVQRGIGWLPGRSFWNDLLQERVTRSVECTDSRFESQLQKSKTHLGYFRKYTSSSQPVPRTVLELGTGWHAVFPIAMFLAGADEVWTWDISRLLKKNRLQQALDHFVCRAQDGRLNELFPEAMAERVSRLVAAAASDWSDPYELLRQFGIRAMVGDASHTGLPAETMDLISSTVVLEFIPQDAMPGMLREFRRTASAACVTSHEVDLIDQFSYFDPSITPFNFLRYSDRTWRLINNPIIPLNRLRVADYRKCFQEAGFSLVDEVITRGDPEALATIPLAPRFARYDTEDLLALKSWFVARPS